jgi:hypothetical protein
MAARGLNAVNADTRVAAALTARRACWSSDDIAKMTFHGGAAARQPGHPARERKERAPNGEAFLAIVGHERIRGAPVELLDGRKPRQTHGLANGNDQKRDRGQDRQRQAEKAEFLAAREQILDQANHREAGGEQDQTAQGAPKQRAPTQTPAPPWNGIVDRDDRRLGVGFRYHLHGAFGRFVFGQADDHVIVVEAKDGGRPMGPVFAHCSRSPIRNCSARSRRM